MSKILITGGAGFIGSHVTRLFVTKYPEDEIYNLDKLTYAGNLENLADIEDRPNYHFIQADITDQEAISRIFQREKFNSVIHLAAESHVDRSISSPLEFIQTNIFGTVNLLEAFRSICVNQEGGVFYHISTDEVYGSLEHDGYFTETTRYDPRSPYSASKASSDHFVRAYQNTYNLRVIITNCSNNYGPNQFPEKLIPLCINNIRNNKEIPVYGKGENSRDWLYVEDHAAAIDLIFHKGSKCQTYNIGGMNEWKNIDLVLLLCRIMDEKLNREKGSSEKLIRFVRDRAGHDLRYAIDPSRLVSELNWKPSVKFEDGLAMTVDWYLRNQAWLDHITSGVYQEYYRKHYNFQ
jgi:dTDP-glucose 4,6-dehydratase